MGKNVWILGPLLNSKMYAVEWVISAEITFVMTALISHLFVQTYNITVISFAKG